ncbi:MAG: hypothetical protein HY553_14690 [Elusimicrobia bacterium]|nr:hypothetical protein [Elusimicrobiota bacterium]
MTIQIDIDDTITWAPAFFAWLSRALKRDGHRVRIVTARGRHLGEPEATAAELRKFGLVWDDLVLSEPVPEIDLADLPEDFPEGLIHLWPKCRATMAEPPDLVFDDSLEVNALLARYLPRVKILRPMNTWVSAPEGSFGNMAGRGWSK